MKKLRTILITSLMVIAMVFGLASCSLLQQGKYEVKSYKFGALSVDFTSETPSYVQLKGDDVAVVSIQVASVNWSGTGTWAADDEGKDKTVDITVNGITFEAVIDGSTMTLNVGIGTILLEK